MPTLSNKRPDLKTHPRQKDVTFVPVTIDTPSLGEMVVDFVELTPKDSPEIPVGQKLQVARFAVTNELYQAVMDLAAPPSKIVMPVAKKIALLDQTPPGYQRVDFPVTNVSLWDAVAFCNAFTRLHNQTHGTQLREAYIIQEDEHGNKTLLIDRVVDANAGFSLGESDEFTIYALAGEKTQYAGSDNPLEVAWFNENVKGTETGEVQLVGQLMPNAWGLFDCSGNTWEWTQTERK